MKSGGGVDSYGYRTHVPRIYIPDSLSFGPMDERKEDCMNPECWEPVKLVYMSSMIERKNKEWIFCLYEGIVVHLQPIYAAKARKVSHEMASPCGQNPFNN